MKNYLVDPRDQLFVLYEQLGLDELCGAGPFEDHTREIFDMVLKEAERYAVEVLEPTIKDGEDEGCHLEEGKVRVPKSFHPAYERYCKGGWISMSREPSVGGQGLPYLLEVASREYLNCNAAFCAYPGLAEGAAHLIQQFGTEQQKNVYMKKMFTGAWSGTMVLTEPGAGSDVGSLATTAKKQPDGSYTITGTKIFITGGDHDLTENIIHMVLARIEGAPAGTRGVSLFLVPKYIVNDDGTLGRRNDYTIGGIEKKMGFTGSATCLMNFGDNGNCYAELLGEENRGMKNMFVLMNEARISVGLQGLAAASRSYLNALKYSRERIQGADLANFRNPEAPRVPTINHPDVRRMLLWMKSHTEALRAIIYFAAWCEDKVQTTKDAAEQEKWHGLVELLTPIIKSYGADIGFQVADQAIMVHGGYGYITEYPVEQILRDVKVAAIFEGTNGIQALDLVGRKLGQKQGAYFADLVDHMRKTLKIDVESNNGLMPLVEQAESAVKILEDMGDFFARCSREGKFLVPISNASPFLNMAATIISAWMLVWQASIAQKKLDLLSQEKGVTPDDWVNWARFIHDTPDAAFYAGKIASATYFIRNILPQADAIARAIRTEDLSLIEIADSSFGPG